LKGCPPHVFRVPSPAKDVTPIGVCKGCGHKREMLNSLPGVSYWRNAKGVRPTQKKARAAS
jgi:hypothetical protein